MHIYIYIYIHIYDSKSLDVVQSLYFGSKLPSSGTYNVLWCDASVNLIYTYIYIYIYDSKSLDVVQSLYFGSKLPSSGTYKIYLYVPDEGSLLPKYRDCTTSNDF